MSEAQDPMIPVPRSLLRDVATYLYQQGEDMLREQLETYAWDEGPQDWEPLSPEFRARLEAAVERGLAARARDHGYLGNGGKQRPALADRCEVLITVLPATPEWERGWRWHCRDCDVYGKQIFTTEDDAKRDAKEHIRERQIREWRNGPCQRCGKTGEECRANRRSDCCPDCVHDRTLIMPEALRGGLTPGLLAQVADPTAELEQQARERECSTCHQPFDAPPCSRNPITGKGGHTVYGGCAAGGQP